MVLNQLTVEESTFCIGAVRMPVRFCTALMRPSRAALPRPISRAAASTMTAMRIPFFFRYSFKEAPLPVS